MIERKRLEELIEQGATVWEVVYAFKGSFVKKYDLKGISTFFKKRLDVFEDLHEVFETKEEAEFYREFGNIERTERLELPTWEEFKKDGEFTFLDKQGFEWDLYSPDDETRISLVGGYDHYEFDYTKENYTLACRKAKELFLGCGENE